ncbi:MAG: S1 RNA-binding domain-containing protein [Anaerolineales bacterium]
MGQRGEWIPPDAPLSEGYWQALLRDGENGRAAPTVSEADLWGENIPETPESPEESEESNPLQDVWEEARSLMAETETLELPVVGCNRGGLLVDWKGLQGFVPASHLPDLTPSGDEEMRQEELRRFVGTRLPLRIIELDRDADRFVLSERATQVDDGNREDVLNTLEPGDVCEGRVTNLCSFGAFVDLGGFEGLVHISELSWGRVAHPADVLESGQSVDVYVLNVEPERERVGLSLKRLQPNPWESVEDRYSVGQIVEGTVTHVVDFGAFVQVEEGLEGLIHVSELASGNPCDPHDVLRDGDDVAVEVLNIDRARRRMGLRLEQFLSNENPSEAGETGDREAFPEEYGG